MCGRFTHKLSWEQIHRLYDLTLGFTNLEPSYNVAPTDRIHVVIVENGKRALAPVRWGLVPAWWKKSLKELPATFNARAESIATKPMFKEAYAKRRCIVPASGFYEWTGDKKNRQPHYITPRDEPVFSFAGLWEEWVDPASGEVLRSATIIVTDAQEPIRALHDRMPVMLAPEDHDGWLNGTADIETLAAKPMPPVNIWPVSPRVNAVKNNEPDLIERIEQAA
jgi:putative SOS response-associated peptidase YedK